MHPEDTVRIPLRARDGSVRAYALIDAADADLANGWRWRFSDGYAARQDRRDGRRTTIYLHRTLLGLRPGDGLDGDHINRDRLDNRRSNLRILPHKGRANAQNSPSFAGSSSQYRGVYWNRRKKKWAAQMQMGGKTTYLGLFTNETEAADAARVARLRLMPYAVD
jgi:hypothetical protein